mmetsp:Transcript_7938/g.16814  ORF Transcript_7938/g.16814 Transcript_7938/m.16814 type:complete len:368 (-) Transcript_7938:623-1726(-)
MKQSVALLVGSVLSVQHGAQVVAFAPLRPPAAALHSVPLVSPRSSPPSTLLRMDTVEDAEEAIKAEVSKDPLGYLGREIKAMDMNAVINSSIIVLISVTVLSKFTLVNAGIMRGWTPAEMAVRIPVDNWLGYSAVLENSPVSTKAVTSATVYTIGDFIAQRTEGASIGEIDRPRIVRSALAGLIGHGPLSHVWYEVSEGFFTDYLRWTEWWSTLPKVVLDQTTWAPFWNNFYIIMLGVMKLESPKTIWADIKRTTIPLIVSGLKLWPLAHCVTYGLIPVENRLLWVDMVEILWVTILATQAAGGGAAVQEGHGVVQLEEIQQEEGKVLEAKEKELEVVMAESAQTVGGSLDKFPDEKEREQAITHEK